MIMSIISGMDVLKHNNLNCPSQRKEKKEKKLGTFFFQPEPVCYSLQYYFVNELALACCERRRASAEGSR